MSGSSPTYRSNRDVAAGGSALRAYQEAVVGSRRLGRLILYEVLTGLLGPLPGALGLVLRRLFYPRLLGSCGRGVVIGRNVIIRHPGSVHLGDRVVIDDNCVLDGRSTGGGILLEDEVILSRGVTLACKDGEIRVGARTGIGLLSTIHAVGRSGVEVGPDCAIGAYTYLIGGSHYKTERLDVPIASQGLDLRGGVRVGRGCWFGARVTVVDGVRVGDHAIVGAAAVVTKDVPEYAVAVGVPARVVASRRDGSLGGASSDDA